MQKLRALTFFSHYLLQVLEGQRVLPKKAQELGFTYKYRFISDALKASFSA
jgi:NAD dependent epimerase/dehydratase family enzyme